jgi:hypothetical protein
VLWQLKRENIRVTLEKSFKSSGQQKGMSRLTKEKTTGAKRLCVWDLTSGGART